MELIKYYLFKKPLFKNLYSSFLFAFEDIEQSNTSKKQNQQLIEK